MCGESNTDRIQNTNMHVSLLLLHFFHFFHFLRFVLPFLGMREGGGCVDFKINYKLIGIGVATIERNKNHSLIFFPLLILYCVWFCCCWWWCELTCAIVVLCTKKNVSSKIEIEWFGRWISKVYVFNLSHASYQLWSTDEFLYWFGCDCKLQLQHYAFYTCVNESHMVDLKNDIPELSLKQFLFASFRRFDIWKINSCHFR